MNDEKPQLKSAEDGSLDNNEPSSLSKAEKLERLEELEEILDAIPEPEQKEKAQSIWREFTKIIERPSQLDPENTKIITESIDKDNERKFQYLIQKQKDETTLEQGELEFRKEKHRDGFSLVKPVVYFVLLVVAACLFTGVWLCYIGKETLGASLITGSLTAVLSFAAGFGASNLLKDEKK